MGRGGSDHPGLSTPEPRALLPHSTLAVLDGVRHFPHVEAPQRFVTALQDFRASTEAAVFDAATWQARPRVTQAPDCSASADGDVLEDLGTGGGALSGPSTVARLTAGKGRDG